MGQFVTLEFVPFAEGGVALETGVRLVAGHDANHGRRGRRRERRRGGDGVGARVDGGGGGGGSDGGGGGGRRRRRRLQGGHGGRRGRGALVVNRLQVVAQDAGRREAFAAEPALGEVLGHHLLAGRRR